ncbi:hypothetical protein E1A91_A04G052900v1 [Gossypium mustelinum]|uniref:Cytochrome b561 domain-containing protein n=1 Tax=Gossypium mustelinum TaxID=34275 RepID=A0A5D2ZKX9_GOSMU|nr:hypothetical protein E1A91_A04G052900v1 [Gossypium mustelinum]
MYNSKSSLLLLLFLINSFIFFCNADSGTKCSNTSSLIGFESNFTMVQHQLRGHFKILDDCSFQVSRFDMLSGSSDVVFWGAVAVDFSNITRGFPISDHRLNQTTYKNASFSIQLLPNVTWDQIKVLSVWDVTTLSDFGHLTLPTNGSDLYPGRVHTMFDNCKNLSGNYRVRWSLNVEDNWIEIGLEAATKTMNYMAFGWANPNRTKELMLGADIAVAAFTEEARGEKKSGYLAIAFGGEMVNSYAYVGWIDNAGKGRLNTYWIDGKDASNVHLTNENLTHVRCKSENGIITFEFTRPFNPSCSSHDKKKECKNILDPTTPLRVVWAMGAKWSEHLSERNMHSVTSQRPVRVMLLRGSSEAEQDLRPVLAVHGFMMFLAWGILLPGGILAARYLKHVKGDGWYQIHVYLQYSGLAIILLAVLFAVAELHGFFVSSLHVKFGIAAIFCACVQPVNAYLRPKKPDHGVEASSNRIIWEYFHVIVGRGAIVVGIAALFTGMKHLGERYKGENVHGLSWALIIWFLIGALLVIYLEYRERQRRRDRFLGRGNWVLGNVEEDDSVDLLNPHHASARTGSQNSGLMEVQLEPLSR